MKQRDSFSIQNYPCLALSMVFCSNSCIFRPDQSFLMDPALKLLIGIKTPELEDTSNYFQGITDNMYRECVL